CLCRMGCSIMIICFFIFYMFHLLIIFFFQAEDGIRDRNVTGVQTCALPISTRCANSLVNIEISPFIIIFMYTDVCLRLVKRQPYLYASLNCFYSDFKWYLL